ncbi:immunoglobulin domain-containing protein [Pedobacter sp. GSP4]|uniref:immunoglobulin domain-containing protein n=1 Tax=Pedobacter sp. GSP4 TaxID=3453716 RepID=UPI003EE961C5
MCTNQSRVYASFQDYQYAPGGIGSSVSVTNNGRAVDTDPSTASTLSINSLLGSSSVTQYLEFSSNGTDAGRRLIAAGKTFILKVSIPASALSLAGTIEVGSFVDLNTSTNIATRTPLYTASTVGLLSGAGAIEIPLTPAQAYHGVYVKLSASLSVGVAAEIYGAYILEDNPLDIECDKGIDVLTGVNGAGLLNATASVTNPYAAIDTDPAYSTFATINTGLQAANEAYLTAIFAKEGQPLDSIKIVYDGGGGLSLLSGFTIQPYLGDAVAGGAFNNGNVTVKAIPNTTRFEVSFPVSSVFDRVKISWGGILAIGTELHIYNVTKAIPKPDPLIDGVPLTAKNVCLGHATTLSINNIQSCTTYTWYADKTTTTPLFTGSTYSLGVLPVGDYGYYVESRRNNCISSISERVKVTIKVNPLPTVAVTNVISCSGFTVNLSVDSPLAGISYNWYDAATGGNLQHSGSTYTTPVLTANTTYYVEAVNQTTGCISSSRAVLAVQVKPIAVVGAISGVNKICIGTATTLSNPNAGGTWSSANLLIAIVNATTGEVTGVAAGTTVIRYTVAADATVCTNFADFNLTVAAPPGLSLGPEPEICSGFTSSSISYSNPVNSPITYSISWGTSGFMPINNQPLPPGNIPFDVPFNAAVGTHSGILTIKNADGCSSQINFTIKIKPKPMAPHVLVPITSQY